MIGSLPSLPQKDDEKRAHHRSYELSLARTRYNYTTSYLYPAPLAAQVPDSERFSLAYKAKVAPVLLEVAENLKSVLVARFEAQLRADLPAMPMPWMVALQSAIDAAKKQFSGLNPLNVPADLAAIVRIFESLEGGPPELAEAYKKMSEIPPLVEGLEKAVSKSLQDMKDVGITSFLRDTLYEVLRTPQTGDGYLHAKDLAEFKTLYPGFPGPPAVIELRAAAVDAPRARPGGVGERLVFRLAPDRRLQHFEPQGRLPEGYGTRARGRPRRSAFEDARDRRDA